MQELSQQQLDELELKWVEIRDLLAADDTPESSVMIDKLDAYFAFFMAFAKQDDKQAEAMDQEIAQLSDKLKKSYEELFAKESPSEALLASFRKLRYYIIWFFGKFAAENIQLRMQLVTCVYQHDFDLNLYGLKVIITQLKAEIVALKEEIAKLQAELEQAKATIASLEEELAQAKDTIAKLEATLVEKQAKIASLSEEVTTLQANVAEHEATIKTQAATIATLEESVADKDSALEASTAAKSVSDEALQASKAELKTLTDRCEEQERALQEKQAVIDKLEAKLAAGPEATDN